MTRRQTTPYDLTIGLVLPEHLDLAHQCIEVTTIYDPDTARYSHADTLSGFRWAAGTLARLGLALTPDLNTLRDCHACRPTPPGAELCGAELHDVRPQDLYGPILTITIPHHEDPNQWTKRITTRLEQMQHDDRWQPTQETP